jgi:hypothetical protein
MTAWHDELTSVGRMARFAASIQFGGTEYVLALVVGDSTAYREAVEALREQTAIDLQEDR